MDDNGLTREDIAAMRAAEGVHFHTHAGRSWIALDLNKHGGRDRIYTVREQTLFPDRDKYAGDRSRDVEVPRVRLEDYSGATGDYDGFYSEYRMDVWRTIAGALKVGDVLEFYWIRDNNNEILTNAGLHCDELLMRAGQPDKPARVWKLATEVRQDNSARMVTRGHR